MLVSVIERGSFELLVLCFLKLASLRVLEVSKSVNSAPWLIISSLIGLKWQLVQLKDLGKTT